MVVDNLCNWGILTRNYLDPDVSNNSKVEVYRGRINRSVVNQVTD